MSNPQPDPVEAAASSIAGDASELEPSTEISPQRGLRRLAARGALVLSAFQIGFAGLALVQRVAVAAFLTAEEFGLWGILIGTIVALSWLKRLGIGDKYVQQNEPNQELAFQKAFTLELAASIAFFIFVALAIPVYALAFGHEELLLPGLILALVVPISAFETPTWISFRNLDYVRQRTLISVDPLVAFVVTIALGVLGAGYWCLVIGAVAGSIAGGTVATLTCPYPIRLRYDRGTLREYAKFSWPLVGLGLTNMVVIQGTLLVANRTVGLAGLGAIALAGSVAHFADRVDAIVSQAIYPAVCRVADRAELLHEVFVKSNRIVLMWAIPFGVGLALFASDLVSLFLGPRWDDSVDLLIGIGLISAFNQIAFNWAIFMRARNDTKPLLISALIGAAVFVVVMVPALLTLDLAGWVVGFAVATVVQISVRFHFLRRILPGFEGARHLWRAIAPSIPAAGAILVIRLVDQGGRGAVQTGAEFAIYLLITIGCTVFLERDLLRESLGYLRRRAANPPGGAVTVSPDPTS